VIGNRLCIGAVAWRPDDVSELYTVSRGVDPNQLGLRTVPLWSGLNHVAVDILDFTDRPWVQPLLWRAPVWCYALYIVLARSARRRRRAVYLLPALLPLAIQITILAVNPAQDARYMFPALMYVVLVLPLVAERRRVALGGDSLAEVLTSRES
jgi:hypothetical protein